MCDLLPASQPVEKIGKMKKLRRTLSESFGRIGKSTVVCVRTLSPKKMLTLTNLEDASAKPVGLCESIILAKRCETIFL